MDLWAAIAAERRELADLLDTIGDDEWDVTSLCGGWAVRDVVGHLTMPFHLSVPRMMLGMLTNGFDFNKVSDKVSRERGATIPPKDLTADLRANAEHHFTPPGNGPIAPLTDIVVHGQDIRRPLGRTRTIPEDRARAILDFLTAGRTFGFVPKGRLKGLKLEATDLDWSWGDGQQQQVRGPAEALIMSATGRPAALDDLEGEGVASLRARM
jgi:uncharacterized protein (TIGR03083 family)